MQNVPVPKLAIFDVDGTIADNGKINEKALQGIAHLQSIGCKTTVSTGRGYLRVKGAFGDLFDRIVSDDAPLILEHGTKITDKAGNVIYADYFSDKTVTEVIDLIRLNIETAERIQVYPDSSNGKILQWFASESMMSDELGVSGYDVDASAGSLSAFAKKLSTVKFCNIGVRLMPHAQVHNLKLFLAHSPLTIIFQDGKMNIIPNNINKGLAILYCMRQMGIDYSDVLVAGNAINDVEMLNLSVGGRILVGPPSERAVIRGYLAEHESLQEVESPTGLGNALLAIG